MSDAHEEPPEPPPPRAPVRPPPRLAWSEPEVAWPAALLAGFVGTYLGVQSRIPGMPALFATVFFAPLYLVLLRNGRTRFLAVLALGWVLAAGVSAGGSAVELGFVEVARAVPGAWRFRETELRPFLADGREAGSTLVRVGRNAGLLLVLLALSRPTAGVVSLLGLASVATAVGAGIGWFADLAVQRGRDPLTTVLTAIPPHYSFQVVGGVLVAVVLAVPRHLQDLGPGASEHRRQLLVAGGALVVLGLALDPLLVPSWGAWLAGTAGSGS